MSSDFYNLFLHDGASANSVEVIADPLTANRVIRLPNTSDTLATLADIGAAGGGSVTSVALALPTTLFTVTGSPVTTSGTLTAALKSQTANTFLAVGDTAGVPVFKTLTANDVPSLPFTKITGVATLTQLPSIPTNKLTGVLADSQMAQGTNNSYLQLDSGNNGGRLTWNSTDGFVLRNNTGTTDENLTVGNLTVRGTTTTVNSAELKITDELITVANGITGAPPANLKAGLEVRRGTSDNAQLIWDEALNRFNLGTTTTLLRVVRESLGTIQAGNINAGVATITHNLGNQYPNLIIRRTDGKLIEFSVTPVSSNSLTIDVSRAGSTVGWTWYAKG